MNEGMRRCRCGLSKIIALNVQEKGPQPFLLPSVLALLCCSSNWKTACYTQRIDDLPKHKRLARARSASDEHGIACQRLSKAVL